MLHNDKTIVYSTPPLAGRPPFATDEDHLYEHQPQSARMPKEPATPNHSAFTKNLEGYRDSGVEGLGRGLMNADMDDDPFDDAHASAPIQKQQAPIPLAAPRPGYAAPVAALSIPSPVATPAGRSPSPTSPSGPKPLMLVNNLNNSAPNSPRLPSPAAIGVPSTPHPLPPTMTPIMPVFARPTKTQEDRDVKFAPTAPILRGEKEETLLPKRGERGDDFWRRFSMVLKEESKKRPGQKQSMWLRKTENGSTRFTRWIWVIGLLLLACIAGAIGIGWWIGHNDNSHNAPTALGGSANEKAMAGSSTAAVSGTIHISTSFHVSPTNTVARREPNPLPTVAAVAIPPLGARAPAEGENVFQSLRARAEAAVAIPPLHPRSGPAIAIPPLNPRSDAAISIPPLHNRADAAIAIPPLHPQSAEPEPEAAEVDGLHAKENKRSVTLSKHRKIKLNRTDLD